MVYQPQCDSPFSSGFCSRKARILLVSGKPEQVGRSRAVLRELCGASRVAMRGISPTVKGGLNQCTLAPSLTVGLMPRSLVACFTGKHNFTRGAGIVDYLHRNAPNQRLDAT